MMNDRKQTYNLGVYDLNCDPDITYNEIVSDIDEDFANAMDVLSCVMGNENKAIIKELYVIYERKSLIVSKAYGLGVKDGMDQANGGPPKTTFRPHNHF
ncbi:hypothetical protein ABIC86_002520 [Paenibacillus sp. DS2363]|uniref:hypothetical protein n=1 Tax=Paenibacillus sp. DS2363 TaxID=3156427 RepID=UPI00339B34BF